MELKLCFGTRVRATDLARAMGLRPSDVVHKKCPSCEASNAAKGNFCANCGLDLRKPSSDMCYADVIEHLTRRNAPPRSISLIGYSERSGDRSSDMVCVCWPMAHGHPVAEYDKPAAYCHWSEIESAIRSYLGKYDLCGLNFRLFAILED